MFRKLFTAVLCAALTLTALPAGAASAMAGQKAAETTGISVMTASSRAVSADAASGSTKIKVSLNQDAAMVRANLKLRSTMNYSTPANLLAVVPKGTVVDVMENAGNGWCRVVYGNHQGYVRGGYLKIFTPKLMKTRTALNMRSRQDITNRRNVITQIPKGKKVAVLQTYKNGWTLIRWNSRHGFVKTSYLTSAAEYRVTRTLLNLRSSRSLSSKKNIILAIPAGKKVQLIRQYDNGWSKVVYQKVTGYVKSQYLK